MISSGHASPGNPCHRIAHTVDKEKLNNFKLMPCSYAFPHNTTALQLTNV